MLPLRRLLSCLLLVLAMFAQPASAVVVTMDFEDLTNQDARKNLHMRGFVLSVRCHFHVTSAYDGISAPTGQSITFDNSVTASTEGGGYWLTSSKGGEIRAEYSTD